MDNQQHYFKHSTIDDAIAIVMDNPDNYALAANEILKVRPTFVTREGKDVEFARIVIGEFSEHCLRTPMTGEQYQGILNTLSVLSEAYNPIYTSISPTYYVYFNAKDMSGRQYAEILFDILSAYFQDFDLNTNTQGNNPSLLLSILRRNKSVSRPEFDLEAISTLVDRGADMNLSYWGGGNAIQQINCSHDNSFFMVSGLIALGADPFLESPFKHRNGHPFDDKEAREYANYYDYVSHVHGYLVSSQNTHINTMKNNVVRLFDYLTRLKLSNESLQGCERKHPQAAGRRIARSL